MDPTSPIVEVAVDDALGPLNEIEQRHAPNRLFVSGDIGLLAKAPRVSIVGTRRPSELGERRTARLARELCEHGVTVVSGLALGIDTVAHRTSIEARGRTIAVLGTPLDRVSPRSNCALQEEIGRNHLAISQFKPGTSVRPRNFPIRNRLMALISNASVIVEAGATSGTVSHGFEALRLGRPLFLLRSLADRLDLEWVGQIKEYGAQPLDDLEDLLEAIPPAGSDDARLAF